MRFFVLFLFLSLTSCLSQEDSVLYSGSKSISGKLDSLSSFSDSCSEKTANLYKLVNTDQLTYQLVSTSSLSASGEFEFSDAYSSSVDPGVNEYVIAIEGCGKKLERPLTSYSNQDVSESTNMLSGIFQVSTTQSLNLPSGFNLKMEKLIDSLKGMTASQAFSYLQNSIELKRIVEVDLGVNPDLVGYSLPKAKLKSLQDSYAESSTANFELQWQHWNENYPVAVKWYLDGRLLSTETSFSVNFGKNDQGTKKLKALVGAKKQSDGSLNQDLPKQELTWDVVVSNTYPAVAPNLNIVSSSPSNSLNLSSEIDVGFNQYNCKTFSKMIISENRFLAPTDWSSAFSCNASGSQSVSYQLDFGNDGVRNIALWVMDSAGNISSTSSYDSIFIDRSAPSLSLTSLTDGETLSADTDVSITYEVSDPNLGFSALNFYYSIDSGANWINIASNQSNQGSFNWTTPDTTTSNALVKVIATDTLGHSSEVVSAQEFTISQAAPVITQTTLSSQYTTAAVSSVTYGGACENGLAIVVSGAASDSLACNSGAWTYTTPTVSSDGQRTYVFTQSNSISTSVSATWIRDTSPPSLSEFELANGASSLSSRKTKFSFSAADQGVATSNISHYCIKSFISSETAASAPVDSQDSCWISLETLGLNLAKSYSLLEVDPFLLDAFVSENFSVRLWVRDEVGNISNSYLEEQVSFTVPSPAAIENFYVGNSDGFDIPLQFNDLNVALNEDIFLKWKVQAGDTELQNNSLKIYYNTTGTELSEDWIEVDSGVEKSISINSGCTVDSDKATGCYVFNNNISSGIIRFRVEIRDALNTPSTSTSNWINTGNYRLVVGNLSTGVGGNISQFVFSGMVAVADDGTVYAMVPHIGLVKVNDEGIVEILVAEQGSSDVDGNTTVARIAEDSSKDVWLDMDSKGNLYFARTSMKGFRAYKALRRFDVSTETIETIANADGASLNQDGVLASDFKTGTQGWSFYSPSIAPNGDVYFIEGDGRLFSEVNFWKYNASTKRMNLLSKPESSGLEAYGNPNTNNDYSGIDYTDQRIRKVRWVFNADSSIRFYFVETQHATNSNDGRYYFYDKDGVNLSIADVPRFPTFLGSIYQGKDLNLYANMAAGGLYSIDFDQRTNTRTKIVAGGVNGNFLEDGELVSSGQVTGSDYFVGKTGRPYIISDGAVRYVDSEARIQTLMGKFRFGQENLAAGEQRMASVGKIVQSKNGFAFSTANNLILEHNFTTGIATSLTGTPKGRLLDSSLTNIKEMGIETTFSGGSVFSYWFYDSVAEKFWFVSTDESAFRGVHTFDYSGSVAKVYRGGAKDHTYPIFAPEADGRSEAEISTSSSNTDKTGFSLLARDVTNNRILVNSLTFNLTSARSAAWKWINLSDNSLSSYAGLYQGKSAPFSPEENACEFSVDGTLVKDSKVPGGNSTHCRVFEPILDNDNPVENDGPRFVVMDNTGRIVHMPLDNTKAIKTIATIGRGVNKFLYVRGASEQYVYYCSNNSLFRGTISSEDGSSLANTSNEVELSLPGNVACDDAVTAEGTLYYDQQRKSIFFPVKENGFFGVGQYYDPI